MDLSTNARKSQVKFLRTQKNFLSREKMRHFAAACYLTNILWGGIMGRRNRPDGSEEKYVDKEKFKWYDTRRKYKILLDKRI